MIVLSIKQKKILYIAFLLSIIILSLGFRMYHLEADAPIKPQIVREEAAKSFEARNKVLFDKWNVDNLDNYNFWRYQSPVWVYTLVVLFKFFGVGYLQIRLLSILFYLLTLILVYLFLKKSFSTTVVLFSLIFIAFSFFNISQYRIGIMEPMLIFFITLTIYFLYRSFEKKKYFIYSLISFILAVGVKMTAFYISPLIFAIFIYLLFKKNNGLSTKSYILLISITSLVFTIVIIILLSNSQYVIRVVYQIRHILVLCDSVFCAYDVSEGLPITLNKLLSNFKSFFSVHNIYEFLRYLPILLPICILEIFTYLAISFTCKRFYKPEFIIIFWFLLTLFILGFTRQGYARFLLLLFIPAVILSGIFISRIKHTKLINNYYKKIIIFSILILFIFVNMYQYVSWANSISYLTKNAIQDIEEILLQDEKMEDIRVFGGVWTGPMLLPTKFKYSFHRPDLKIGEENNIENAILKNKITHVILRTRKKDYFYFDFFNFYEKELLLEVSLPTDGWAGLYRVWLKENIN